MAEGTPSQSHRMNVKIGDAVFDAEGDTETIRKQYEMWMEAVRATPRKSDPDPARETTSPPAWQGDHEAPLTPNGVASPATSAMAVELRNRLFQERDGCITLKVLPKTSNKDADALVMILLGYHEMRDQDGVNAPTLMRAAKVSGLQLDRIDRVISANSQYINTAGHRRGKRYSLNNQGLDYAKKIGGEAVQ